MATHSAPTAGDFWLDPIPTFPVCPLALFQNLSQYFPVYAVANAGFETVCYFFVRVKCPDRVVVVTKNFVV